MTELHTFTHFYAVLLASATRSSTFRVAFVYVEEPGQNVSESDGITGVGRTESGVGRTESGVGRLFGQGREAVWAG